MVSFVEISLSVAAANVAADRRSRRSPREARYLFPRLFTSLLLLLLLARWGEVGLRERRSFRLFSALPRAVLLL